MLTLHHRLETGPGPVSLMEGYIQSIDVSSRERRFGISLVSHGRGEDILDSGHKRSRTESAYPIHWHEEGDWSITVNVTVMMGWICR